MDRSKTLVLLVILGLAAPLAEATPYYNLGAFWRKGGCNADAECGAGNYCVARKCETTAASCLVLKGWGRGDGTYLIKPMPSQPAVTVFCDNTNQGGGWTRVVNIQSGSFAHADTTTAVGDVSVASAAAKLSDAMINALNTVGYFRYNCGGYQAFVKNTANVWTSARTNPYTWSIDRGFDGTFECAATRSGYVFSDHPACTSGHTDYAAANGPSEGNGCYNGSWNLAGNLWAK